MKQSKVNFDSWTKKKIKKPTKVKFSLLGKEREGMSNTISIKEYQTHNSGDNNVRSGRACPDTGIAPEYNQTRQTKPVRRTTRGTSNCKPSGKVDVASYQFRDSLKTDKSGEKNAQETGDRESLSTLKGGKVTPEHLRFLLDHAEKQIETEIKHIKEWLQSWVIDMTHGDDLIKLMEKELWGDKK